MESEDSASFIVPYNDLSRIHGELQEEFIDSLKEVLENSDFILGSGVSAFENAYAELEQAKNVITVNSGTSALILILKSLGIGPGDEVLVPAMTFVATAFAVTAVAATPKLIDVDEKTGLMNLSSLTESISKKTKAAIFVTLHGRVDNLDSFYTICRDNKIYSVIDAAQSHLGTFDSNSQVKYSDATSVSFYPGKNLGALGEGGAVLTDNSTIAERIRVFRNWGGRSNYDHADWGGNFRLETLQCLFLLSKLKHLSNWTRARQALGARYRSALPKELLLDDISARGSHVYHIFALRHPNKIAFRNYLEEHGIKTSTHYPKPIHLHSAYREFGGRGSELQGSEAFAANTISIPIYPHLKEREFSRIVEVISNFG
jgi:dTDP-4-amino-4,6-dideoxygalactose transaminase